MHPCANELYLWKTINFFILYHAFYFPPRKLFLMLNISDLHCKTCKLCSNWISWLPGDLCRSAGSVVIERASVCASKPTALSCFYIPLNRITVKCVFNTLILYGVQYILFSASWKQILIITNSNCVLEIIQIVCTSDNLYIPVKRS